MSAPGPTCWSAARRSSKRAYATLNVADWQWERSAPL